MTRLHSRDGAHSGRSSGSSNNNNNENSTINADDSLLCLRRVLQDDESGGRRQGSRRQRRAQAHLQFNNSTRPPEEEELTKAECEKESGQIARHADVREGRPGRNALCLARAREYGARGVVEIERTSGGIGGMTILVFHPSLEAGTSLYVTFIDLCFGLCSIEFWPRSKARYDWKQRIAREK